MKTEDTTQRQIQHLATVLTLIIGYYTIRAALNLPKVSQMLSETDMIDALSLGGIILEHPYLIIAISVGTTLVTMTAIWWRFKNHHIVYPVGIAFQFFLADRVVASATDPIFRMISIMSEQ